MRLIRNFILATFALVTFITSLNEVMAHPGNTDSNGGHVCRTNCSSWGYEFGEYHFHSTIDSASSSFVWLIILGGLSYFFYRVYKNNANSK